MFEIVCDRELAKHNIRKEDVIIPTRKTKYSAGYDFHSPLDYRISSKENILIPTGIKCKFDMLLSGDMLPNSIYLHLCLKSGFSLRNTIFLTNGVGTIESDYYDNVTNDGHILISLYNYGDKLVHLEQGHGIIQGIFIPFFTFGDIITRIRIGGWGSTE